ncbi:MAG: MMPL family transporter, partial [Planctomycetaceae bacterium]
KTKAQQYFPPEELEACLSNLDSFSDVLSGRWDRAGLQVTTEQLHRQLQADDLEKQSESLARAKLLTHSLQRFVGTGEFASPWMPCLSPNASAKPADFSPVYQITPSGKMGLLLTIPVSRGEDFQGSSPSIDRLRELIAETERLYDGVEIGLTGIPVLESDEMRRSQFDMTLASILSLGGVGALMFLGFRGVRHPLLAMLMLLVGLAWSLGYATLFVGHLNILSVSFAAILIGLGIDFSIHYLARYLALRHEGVRMRPALLQTSWSVGPGIVTAAVTTALAFFCATFTSFLGVAELGVIAGGGILLCCLTTFVVLPALITLSDRKAELRRLPTQFQGTWLRRITFRRPVAVTVLSVSAILSVGACAFTFEQDRLLLRVSYDANLLNLQADDVDSVAVQNRVFGEAQGSLLYAISQVDDRQELLRRRAEFEKLPSVSRVEELASHLPQHDPARTRLLVQEIASQLSHLSDFPREFPRLNPQAIGLALEDLFVHLQEIDDPIARESAAALDAFLDRLETFPLNQQVELLDGYQYAMLAALKGQFEAIAAIADPTPVSPRDFPQAVRERFVNDDGTWLMRIYPKDQVWDEEPLSRFVAEVRSVDPDATGTPLQNYEAARQIRESYVQAALYALAVIWLVLLVDTVDTKPLLIGLLSPLAVVGFAVVAIPSPHRLLAPIELVGLYIAVMTAAAAIFDVANVRCTFLALLPPVGGFVLMFGILGLFGVELNPANLIVLPLILGIGVDDGVHVIHDFRAQRGRYHTSPSTINAIMLTSLTSMIGFGSMLVASHRGLASLGLVLVIGVGSCLFVSLVTLPAILTLISRRQTDEGLPAAQEHRSIGLSRIHQAPTAGAAASNPAA